MLREPLARADRTPVLREVHSVFWLDRRIATTAVRSEWPTSLFAFLEPQIVPQAAQPSHTPCARRYAAKTSKLPFVCSHLLSSSLFRNRRRRRIHRPQETKTPPGGDKKHTNQYRLIAALQSPGLGGISVVVRQKRSSTFKSSHRFFRPLRGLLRPPPQAQ